MFDDLASYYYENVILSYVNYRDRRNSNNLGLSRDIADAIVAATNLFHFREHLPSNLKPSRSKVEKLCPDFGLLADIVNAAKHKTINDETPHGAPVITSANSITEDVIIVVFYDSAGEYRFVQKRVVVKLDAGGIRDLMEIMTTVINFWEQFLCDKAVLKQARTFAFEDCLRVRTREECNDGTLNLEAVRGMRFKGMSFHLYEFNAASNKVEPVDLTGATARFTIRPPAFNITIQVKNEVSGMVYSKEIELKEADAMHLSSLKDDQAKDTYIQSLDYINAEYHELVGKAQLDRVDELSFT